MRTYIRSGKVLFETDQADRVALTRTIERRLRHALGYDVPAFLRTVPELEEILAIDPFRGMDVTDDMRLCITFTADPITDDLALPLHSAKRDMAIVHTTEREAFVVWYLIDGRPPASSSILAKALGDRTTTRFFHTTAKILQAAKGS